MVSDLEHATLRRLASLLDIPASRVPEITELPGIDGIASGMRVCFTGTAVGPDGSPRSRDDLERIDASEVRCADPDAEAAMIVAITVMPIELRSAGRNRSRAEPAKICV